MTAAVTPARHAPSGQDARLRPVPWRHLAWASWRQCRVSLTGTVALLGALALYLLITRLRMGSAYASVASCRPAGSAACSAVANLFNTHWWLQAEIATGVLQGMPALIGAFAGAPILARELESGTFRFAWTQGVGRIRWTVARLALPAVTVVAATAAFSQLFGWYFYPFFADGQDSRFSPQFFNLTGIAFAAWTLTAFAIGIVLGVLNRRVVPAIAASIAASAGLLLVTVLYLRPHYQAPIVTSGSNGAPAAHGTTPWVVSQWFTGPGGRPVSFGTMMQLAQSGVYHASGNGSGSIFQGLFQHGYTEWTSYQPASRFWGFQLIEAGWLLALCVLVIAATIWLIRRRAG
jgi:ABC-type transport system involved in multi-copper enzyme maturation permease subunit